jgi:hypothetical protein
MESTTNLDLLTTTLHANTTYAQNLDFSSKSFIRKPTHKTIPNISQALLAGIMDRPESEASTQPLSRVPSISELSACLEFENLHIVKKIGSGGFSEAFQVIDEYTQQEYALR